MAVLTNIIYLTKAQYTTLKNNGSITVGDVTYTYDPNADYRIPLTGEDYLTEGDNITISGNTISATDTTYTAKENSALTLTGTEFDVDQSKISYTNITDKPAIEGTGLTSSTKATDILKGTAPISIASGTGSDTGKGVVSLNINTSELEVSSNNLQIKDLAYSKVSSKPTVNGTTITGTMKGSDFVSAGNGVSYDTNGQTLSVKVKTGESALTNSSDGLSIDQGQISYTNITNKPALDGTTLSSSSTKAGLGIQEQVVAGDGLALANDNKTLSASVDGSTLTIDSTSKKIKGNYQAGTNVQISGNTISATDTTYTAGTNIEITSGAISTKNIYTITEVDSLISGITSFEYEVVQTLPTTGVKGKIYLVPDSRTGEKNIHKEYIWVTPKSGDPYYEQIGTTDVDISGKVDKITTANANEVYVHQGSTQTAIAYTTDATASTIAYRGTGGVLSVGTPTADAHAATKSYVDTADATKVDKISTTSSNGLVYGVSTTGTQTSYTIDPATGNGIASYSALTTGLGLKQNTVNIIRLDA